MGSGPVVPRQPPRKVIHHITAKENPMKRNEKRVLGRTGARELTPQELACIIASQPVITDIITFNPFTGERDGDG
jgi:hypothetical protein